MVYLQGHQDSTCFGKTVHKMYKTLYSKFLLYTDPDTFEASGTEKTCCNHLNKSLEIHSHCLVYKWSVNSLYFSPFDRLLIASVISLTLIEGLINDPISFSTCVTLLA